MYWKLLKICNLIINSLVWEMAKCDLCGEETPLPFRCRRCGGTFCIKHRLPENHSCKATEGAERRDLGRDITEIPAEREVLHKPVQLRYEIKFPMPPRRRPSFFRDFVLRQASLTLLLIIFVVFVIQLAAEAMLGPAYFRPGDYGTFLYYLTLSPSTVIFRPWTLVTSIFAHGGFAHLLVNGIVLFSLGPVLEARIGRRKFVYLFLGSGILAGTAQILVIPPDFVVLGASGAILGVLGALTALAPRMRVLMFFLIPLQLWVVTLFFGALSAVLVLTNPGGSIAHMAHFTGLVVGLLYGYEYRRRERERARPAFPMIFRPYPP